MSRDHSLEDWLSEHGLAQYRKVFEDNDIDLRALPHLKEEDLKEIGVSLGHRRLLLSVIQSTLASSPASSPSEPVTPQEKSNVADDTIAERRQITVMFCDLIGSTELSQRLDPEDLRELLNRYRDDVAQAISRYEGYVAQFLGDGVLAYFGWPLAFEDQAERAVHAALEIVKSVRRIATASGDPIEVRIGIDTGEVVVGRMVTNATSDSDSATGETPNRAARLQGLAQTNQIVIGRNTRRLVGKAFVLTEMQSQKLRGFSSAESSWIVVGENAVEGRFAAAHEGPLGHLVGREQEVNLLAARWAQARGGEGQVISITGEAGIGKSGLIQAFRTVADQANHLDVFFQCSAHHTDSAFFPLIHQIQRAAGFVSDDSSDTKLDKLETLLDGADKPSDNTMRLVSALLSLPGEKRYGQLDLSPQQLRFQTIEALIRQLLRAASKRPVLVIVEDAHWIDPSMREFVEQFIPRISDERVLVLVSYRPENAPPWAMNPNVASINLTRLGRHHALAIARSVGGSEIPDSTFDDIVQRAQGVPLFVEEVTKSVREVLELSGQPATPVGVPATLQSSLISRLDRLGSAKEIAQIGAVIGREFSYGLIISIADWPESEVAHALDRLVESELLYRRGLKPNATYTFKHALVQDAAYGTILLTKRRDLHARIVNALTAQPVNAGNHRVESIGRHAFHAGIWDTAFSYLSRAGQNAMDGAAIREAMGQYERALKAASKLPSTPNLSEKIIDIRFALRNALWSIGEFEQILTHLEQAEILASELEDSSRLGWISVFRSASYWQLGVPAMTLSAADESLRIANSAQDLSLSVGANFYLGCAQVTSGNLPEAERLFGQVIDIVSGDLSHDRCGLPFVPAVVARSWLVWSLAERGEFEAGLATAQEALQIAKEVGNPFNLAHIYYDLGYLHACQGNANEAVSAQENAMALITEWNLTYLEPFIGGFLGHAYLLAGRTEDALIQLERAISKYESVGLGLFRSLVTVYYAQALFQSGQFQLARQYALQGVKLAIDRGERGHQVYGLKFLGDMALSSNGQVTQAVSYFEQALATANELNMIPVQAHCLSGLAKAEHQLGDGILAKKNQSRADQIYRDLHMTE